MEDDMMMMMPFMMMASGGGGGIRGPEMAQILVAGSAHFDPTQRAMLAMNSASDADFERQTIRQTAVREVLAILEDQKVDLKKVDWKKAPSLRQWHRTYGGDGTMSDIEVVQADKPKATNG